VTSREASLDTPPDRRVPSSSEPMPSPWYEGACPRPDISGCGECRIELKGSALENTRSHVRRGKTLSAKNP
jgi:hypothetical protein